MDVANLASVTIEAAPYADQGRRRASSPRRSPVPRSTPALTEATWADGSRQHALFILSSGEMNVALGGADRADFWLVVTALTTAGDPLVCGTGRFILADDGTFNAAPPPPANPGAGITIEQADLRYARGRRAAVDAGRHQRRRRRGGQPGEPLPTAGLSVPALRTIYLPAAAGDELQDWLLVAGTDATVAGQVQRPADYDAATNPRVWFRKR